MSSLFPTEVTTEALLVLEDGTHFRGRALGASGTVFGEAVFNTGMAGYQEVLSDPSYHRQIVTMTAPHVGNYGVNGDDRESDGIKVAGFVVREAARRPSSWRAEGDLHTALVAEGVVGIEGIDTRRLTRRLRAVVVPNNHYRDLREVTNCQHFFAIRAHHGGRQLRLGQQSLPDLLAIQKRLQRRPIEDCLRAVGLHGGRAMKLQRPPGNVKQQIAAHQAQFRTFKDRQESQARRRSSARRMHAGAKSRIGSKQPPAEAVD
jgi:hypothetical protein